MLLGACDAENFRAKVRHVQCQFLIVFEVSNTRVFDQNVRCLLDVDSVVRKEDCIFHDVRLSSIGPVREPVVGTAFILGAVSAGLSPVGDIFVRESINISKMKKLLHSFFGSGGVGSKKFKSFLELKNLAENFGNKFISINQ